MNSEEFEAAIPFRLTRRDDAPIMGDEAKELRAELTRLREFAHRIGICTCDASRCHHSDYQCLAREALTGAKNWGPGGEP